MARYVGSSNTIRARDSLQIDLKIVGEIRDPSGISERIERTQSWTFDRRIQVRSDREIDGALALIAQAHRFVAGSR